MPIWYINVIFLFLVDVVLEMLALEVCTLSCPDMRSVPAKAYCFYRRRGSFAVEEGMYQSPNTLCVAWWGRTDTLQWLVLCVRLAQGGVASGLICKRRGLSLPLVGCALALKNVLWVCGCSSVTTAANVRPHGQSVVPECAHTHVHSHDGGLKLSWCTWWGIAWVTVHSTLKAGFAEPEGTLLSLPCLTESVLALEAILVDDRGGHWHLTGQ